MRKKIMATSSSSSSGKSYRIVKLEISSAELNKEKKGNFYVHISICDAKVQRTKLVKCSAPNTPSWNQKFVFSVDDKSKVSFTVFKARRFLPDFLVGEATMSTREMKLVDDNGYQGQPKFDESPDEYYYDDAEAEIQEAETFKLKKQVWLKILKGSSEVGKLNISVTAWEKYFPYQLYFHHGQTKKSSPILSGSDEEMGTLTVQKAAKEKLVVFVGVGVKWRNLAMEYDEFMMMAKAQKPPKRSFHICLARVGDSFMD